MGCAIVQRGVQRVPLAACDELPTRLLPFQAQARGMLPAADPLNGGCQWARALPRWRAAGCNEDVGIADFLRLVTGSCP